MSLVRKLRHHVLAWATLLWLGLAATARAHDPGLSTAILRLHEDKLEAVLTFSLVDAAQIADLDSDGDGRES